MQNSPAEIIGTRDERPEQSGSAWEGSYTGSGPGSGCCSRADWNGLLIVWKLDPEERRTEVCLEPTGPSFSRG